MPAFLFEPHDRVIRRAARESVDFVIQLRGAAFGKTIQGIQPDRVARRGYPHETRPRSADDDVAHRKAAGIEILDAQSVDHEVAGAGIDARDEQTVAVTSGRERDEGADSDVRGVGTW